MTIVPSGARKGTTLNYFGMQIFCLKLFGYSLTGNENKLYRIYAIICYFSAFVYLIFDVYELTKHDDINVISEILIYVTAGVIALSKGFVLYRNRAKISELIAKLHQEPFLPNINRGGDQELTLIKQCVWLTKMQTSTYFLVSGTTVAVNTLLVLFKRLTSSDYHDWLFPYGPFTALNVTYSPNYEIACFYQNFSLYYYSAVFVSTDLLLAAILAHLSYQFKILQNYIRQLVKISYNEMFKITPGNVPAAPKDFNYEIDNSITPWPFLKTSLTSAVQYHLDIIGLVNEVEKFFSDLLLLVFVSTLSLLCFTVYTSSMATDNAQAMRHVGEATASCLQVLTICYWGEQVVHESELVRNAAYESNFVGTDLRFQKSLIFIIRRSQNISKLTAGKFVIISLATFAWIMRTSYSSLMILLRANANKI